MLAELQPGCDITFSQNVHRDLRNESPKWRELPVSVCIKWWNEKVDTRSRISFSEPVSFFINTGTIIKELYEFKVEEAIHDTNFSIENKICALIYGRSFIESHLDIP